jgi:hypothetical protein
MEQRSVGLCLQRKGLLKKAIHHELAAVFQENAVSDSSLTRFCAEVILGLDSEEASSPPKGDHLDEVNEMNKAILLALSNEPFASASSVRQISRRIWLPKSFVYCRLVDSLHFTVTHQTFSLGFSQALRQLESKLSRVVDSISRFPIVHPASRRGWGHICP